MASEANEPGSESGKRSDDRRGAARGMRAGCWSPQEGGASNHLTARLLPWASGSFVEAAMVAGEASYLACRLARASKHGHGVVAHLGETVAEAQAHHPP